VGEKGCREDRIVGIWKSGYRWISQRSCFGEVSVEVIFEEIVPIYGVDMWCR